MTVSTAPFRGPNGTPVVLVTTGVRAGEKAAAPPATRPAETAPQLEPIEILTSAFRDGDKNVEWQRQRVSAALPWATPGQLRYESVSTLTLQPGTYEVRVAARHEPENVAGSVYAYVDVPDFDRDPLAEPARRPPEPHDQPAPDRSPFPADGGSVPVPLQYHAAESLDWRRFAGVHRRTSPASDHHA